MSIVKASKIETPQSTEDALTVINAVYLQEKNWIRQSENAIAPDPKHSWFLATVGGQPAGVIRLAYDPSLDFPPEMEVTLNQGINLEENGPGMQDGRDRPFHDPAAVPPEHQGGFAPDERRHPGGGRTGLHPFSDRCL